MKIIKILTFLTLSLSIFANGEEVSKEQWMAVMRTALPAAICQPAQYFRQCFDINATECEEMAASTTRICLNDLGGQIPKILMQPKDGTYWGTIVGECVGTAYETALLEKRSSDPKCNDITNWQ